MPCRVSVVLKHLLVRRAAPIIERPLIRTFSGSCSDSLGGIGMRLRYLTRVKLLVQSGEVGLLEGRLSVFHHHIRSVRRTH